MTVLRTPLLLINCKNFPEVLGPRAVALARAAESVGRELGVEVAVAPPPPYVAQVARAVRIPVLAQHVDFALSGSTTGAIVVEALKETGAAGSLVNHSECRILPAHIAKTLARLAAAGLDAVVCARTPAEVRRLAKLHPPFLAIEPPELIGSGTAVSRARPEVVTASVAAAERVSPATRVICGAGIVSGQDAAAARRLGAQGLLVASSIVRASDWQAKIRELATPLR